MNSRSLVTIAIVTLCIIGGIFAAVTIMLNPTGGIAGLSKMLTLFCIVIAFVSPKSGLFILAAQAIFTDEFKRIGVYYGAVSMQTVQEILIGPLLTICALNAGFLVQILLGRVKIGWMGFALYGIAPLLGIYFLQGGAVGGGDSFIKRFYNAGAAGLYATIVPLSFGLMKEFRDWVKYLSFQSILVIPSAIWGIWQYFNGFNNMEWAYALSGLSPVHSSQMLAFTDPRIFGFFGSASALGCLCGYCAFAAWRGVAIKEKRLLFILIAALLLFTLILSQQRTALLYPFIFAGVAFFYRTKLLTLFLYMSITIAFILGVWNSTWLLDEGLDKINGAIAVEGRWGGQVLKVSTFSDRLRGWERLKRPSSWSLFGTGEELSSDAMTGSTIGSSTYSHDMINKILIKFGAVPLAIIIGTVGSVLLKMHRTVWKIKDPNLRNTGAFILGVIVPILLMSAAGGDNFTTTPFNLMIWSIFGGIFVLLRVLGNSTEVPFPGSASEFPSNNFQAPQPNLREVTSP